MAVAPAPVADPKAGDPPADPPDPPAATESTVDQIVEKVLAKLDVLKPAAKPAGEPAKRKTYRDEEETMGELVTVKVKELLALEKAAGEKHPDPKTEKAEPEPIPAMPAGRRVEKFMGW
jgi:hypothetical protein